MSLEPAPFSSPLWLWFSEQLSWVDDVLLPKRGGLIFLLLGWEFLCLEFARPHCKLVQLA